jgi:hypothetical protein
MNMYINKIMCDFFRNMVEARDEWLKKTDTIPNTAPILNTYLVKPRPPSSTPPPPSLVKC